ncbi:unnamed protein product [Pieris macdunnoughi]|uniref:Uncharacterized protein n=1 Tax=Pieris macdunnoughi TaxID=345717 RepID=A0A821UIF8_9NEOP|nr:unnamed protein product [Pieris macdunnoughi]
MIFALTLHESTNRMYLAPDLGLSKLFSLYKEETPPSEQVSNFMFRKVFNQQFNLSFHAPITDSCKKCDNFKIKIEAEKTSVKKDELDSQRKLHLLKAESARNNFKIDKNRPANDSDFTVIVFDFMKTLPTPVISTGIFYYKRQLWPYCLGIHNAHNDEVTMYVWDETIASRGPMEIGSCLLRFIKEKVKTEKLIMNSDQCGGQNRNIKMTTFCHYIVSTGFLATGRTYTDLQYSFRMGIATISKIVDEVCKVIWETLHDECIPTTKTPDMWQNIAAR